MTLDAYFDSFVRRVIADALAEATRSYWIKRAEVFAAVGNAHCDAVALACRRHAELCEFVDFDETFAAVLSELLEEAA